MNRIGIGGTAVLRFWGQPKYADRELLGYELFLREAAADQWRFPKDFGVYPAAEIADLLIETVKALGNRAQLLSLNLDRPEFIRDDYVKEMGRAQRACPQVQLCVELTERSGNVSAEQLIHAASGYASANLWVCIDDVGTGDNELEVVGELAPYVTEYKFALQNFHDQKDFISLVSPLLQFWREQAKINELFFAIEGFETKADLKIAQNYRADILQGYYFGRPSLIKLVTDD